MVFENKKCKFLIQVCESLSTDNLNRELEGLQEAMAFFQMKEGYILTLDQSDELRPKDNVIHIIPVYQYIELSL